MKKETFNDLLIITEEKLRPLVEELRKRILDIDSSACEVVRLGDRSVTYGVGPKKMSEGYVYIIPYKNWVNLGFYHGVNLTDPKGLLEGNGKKLRHVKNHTLEDVNRTELADLIRESIDERKRALGRD